MRVLFVCSGNSTHGIGNVVFNQAESLRNQGVQIDFFPVKGKGLIGYTKNIPLLWKYLHNNKFDIIHAHYSASAFVASFAVRESLVVSLMGSDAFMSGLWSIAARFFYKFRWDVTIVKSKGMKEQLRMKKALVMPNGVDLNKFKTVPKTEARAHIGYSKTKKLIIFVSDPAREEKNFDLAKSAVKYLDRNNVELMPVFNVPSGEIPFYMNAADVLLLTSKWEGSVNVVKEAMACNLPIVSTDVGDVKENTSDVKGCYVCESNANSLSEGLKKALLLENRTNGREKILELKLDTESVAQKIIAVYEEISRSR
jgi:teichuronic acid biosynthesis glycosyltransferase TuaC